MEKQKGIIKEIIIIIAVIFIIAHFNLDPQKIWNTISGFFVDLYDKIKV